MADARDKEQTKQRIIMGILVIVVIVIIWQVASLFKGGSSAPSITPGASAKATANGGNARANANASGAQNQPATQTKPQAALPPPAEMTEREKQLLALQAQTEAKYVAAMNELQLTRIQSQIAKNRKDIAENQYDSVVSQKKTLDILAGPSAAPSVSEQSVSRSATSGVANLVQADYSAVSVSKLRSHWNGVLQFQGQLYNVRVGDVLPPDGSKVIEIDTHGVTLELNQQKRRILLSSIV